MENKLYYTMGDFWISQDAVWFDECWIHILEGYGLCIQGYHG